MKKTGTILRTLALAGALLLAILGTPTAALANTAAGTVITNIATVTWDGGPAQGVSASATVTVQLLAATPTLAFVESNPTPLTSVSEGTPVTLTYTVTSNANGGDDYVLGAAFADNAAVISEPTATVNGGTATVTLGASMALVDVNNSATIPLPAGAASHGITVGSTVVIDNVEYAVEAVTEGATPSITLDKPVTIAAGTPIQGRKEFTVTFTTGDLQGTNTSGNHVVTTTATGTSGSDSDEQTVIVTKAALTIIKTADPTSAQPGVTVTFTIVVTNDGAAAASDVVITDAIPAFTTFAGGVTDTGSGTVAYSEDGGTDWTGVGGSATTDLRISYGSLANGASVTVTFAVIID